MTTSELESRMLAGVITEQNFRRAKSDLLIMNALQNGLGSLEDTAVFLSDDGRSALAFAFWNDDAKTIYTSFELATPVTEKTFDGHVWAGRLMEGDAT